MNKSPALSKRAIAKIISMAETSAEHWRKKLDKNIHIADISIGALKVSVPSITEIEYNVLYSAFQIQASHVSTSLRNAVKQAKSGDWKGLVFVDDPKYGQYLIAASYSTLQGYVSSVLKPLSSGEYKNLNVLLGVDKHGRTVSRIGHIAGDFSHAETPLTAKLTDIASRLPLTSANKVIGMLSQVQNAHLFEAEYSFTNETSYTKKDLASILGRGTLLVTIHSDEKNSALATTIEKVISDQLSKYVKSAEFVNDLLVEPGSNSIVEDVAYFIRKALDPSIKLPSTHKPSVQKKSVKQKTSKTTEFNLPRIRTHKGQFSSLTGLQRILDARLTQQIKDNMGDGTRRDVLNLRSGRFAESVKVERISQSREGMITAFYTYMKNPYQTFEPGYAQGSPASRNPKTLISKSIREILAEQVKNKLRAVSV